jgi:hypothetical protein
LRYHVSGERPTKYFSALVKQRAEKSAITSLTCKRNGHEVSLTDSEDILEEASNFYATLYSKKLSEDQTKAGSKYLEKNLDLKLSDAAKRLCDRPLTVEELGSALKKLPGGKAPGIDGLPSEFFKMFWNKLKNDFLQVLLESFQTGCLPYSMRMSIITLIFKKNSRSDIRNYRPISLLCTDYKIIAKTFAECMKVVLPAIIHGDQTGFLKDRYIGENITLFVDVQEHLAREAKPGLCFLADWEKAYDLMDRGFIESSLVAFGFGSVFVKWFQILHFKTFSRLTMIAFLTEPFAVQSGIRQGCPWAPFLFLCAIEPLACALRNPKLEGVVLPDRKKWFTAVMLMTPPCF